MKTFLTVRRCCLASVILFVHAIACAADVGTPAVAASAVFNVKTFGATGDEFCAG
jgi:hypothetical protein